jgi:hypothetical protein
MGLGERTIEAVIVMRKNACGLPPLPTPKCHRYNQPNQVARRCKCGPSHWATPLMRAPVRSCPESARRFRPSDMCHEFFARLPCDRGRDLCSFDQDSISCWHLSTFSRSIGTSDSFRKVFRLSDSFIAQGHRDNEGMTERRNRKFAASVLEMTPHAVVLHATRYSSSVSLMRLKILVTVVNTK